MRFGSACFIRGTSFAFDFEKTEEQYAIVGSKGNNTDRFIGQWSQSPLFLSRVLFDGTYVMKGTTRMQYPEAFVELGREYPAGTSLTFRVYVEGSSSDGDTVALAIRAYSGDSLAYTMYEKNININAWNDVTITFSQAHDRFSCFLGLEGRSLIADGKSVNVYYDDFYVGKRLPSIGEKEWTEDDEDTTGYESWFR